MKKRHHQPSHGTDHWQAGVEALQAKQWLKAAEAFERGVHASPENALMWLYQARALYSAQRFDDAIVAAREAYRLLPDNVLAMRLLADLLQQQHRGEEAVAVFKAYAPEGPRDADWYADYGVALHNTGQYRDAITAYFQSLALKLDAPLTHYRLGLSFRELNMSYESTECFRTAVSLDNPDVRTVALSLLVHEGRQSCNWSHTEQDTQDLLAAVDLANENTGQLLSPFSLLAVDASAAQLRRMGEVRSRSLARGIVPFPAPGPRRPGRVRIGYLSSDFHNHATAILMTELLERRNTEQFEVTLYSHSRDDGTPMMHRIRAAADHFVDVSHLTNLQAARRMREDGIDIAVDLKGHTANSRFELLAYRPAPVSVAYLGYPETTGADFIDYLIGDQVVTPLTQAAHYTEHIAQLPYCYQPNDRQRYLPPCPSRAELGLPEDAVVLCCFNQNYKYTPHMLDLWAAILAKAPKAVLWMLAWNPIAQSNLQRELTARGVPPERVFWAPKLLVNAHIARLRTADLFLDTWPCNAHTTASDALWAAVPVLTVPGERFASRVAASLLCACGLPDLACADEATYVEMGASLANTPELLAFLKQELESHRMTLPLFDTDRYTRDYEALLMRMFKRSQAGLPPTALPAETASH